VRLRWWEIASLAGPLAVAVLFLLAKLWVAATIMLALTIFVGASRARYVERNIAGHHGRVRARLLAIRWLALLGIYIAVTVLLFAMRGWEWESRAHESVAFYATGAVAFFLAREILRYGKEADRWWAGSAAEARVAAELERLREEGWLVVHNLDRDGRGNVDHFVSGPSGAYAIETKSGRYRAADRGQAIGNALWAREKFGERWVTPILCVAKDAPAVPVEVPHGRAKVWVIGVGDLQRWLRTQPSRT
jgi:hypothetical protein